MTTPSGSLSVVNYRDFYDIPRLILSVDEASRYWIFDCAFDEELDDYLSSYNVYCAGDNLKAAEDVMALHLTGVRAPLEGVVPIASLEFDPSKRHSFILT